MVQSANLKEAKERGGRLSYPTRVKLTKALSVFILIACASCVYPFFASFKSNVATFGGPVLMGDVISETDVPKETLDKIIVAYLPANSSITLTKKYLYNLLKKRVGIIDVEIDDIPVVIEAMSGNEMSNEEKKNEISEDTINEVVLKELHTHYPDGTTFNLKSQTGKVIDHDSYSITVYATTKSSPFVRVTLQKGGRIVGYVTLQYNAILLRKVAIANRRIEKGEIIGINDVRYEEVNIYSLTKIPTLEEDLPMMANKVFSKDEVIDMKYLSEVPPVIKGQIIKAYSNIGGISVSILAQALENGYIGNVIRIKNQDNGSIINGTVEEDGTIKVFEGK